jgi:hypothetical protein
MEREGGREGPATGLRVAGVASALGSQTCTENCRPEFQNSRPNRRRGLRRLWIIFVCPLHCGSESPTTRTLIPWPLVWCRSPNAGASRRRTVLGREVPPCPHEWMQKCISGRKSPQQILTLGDQNQGADRVGVSGWTQFDRSVALGLLRHGRKRAGARVGRYA